MTDFNNRRAAELPPVEAVVFLLNYENDTNINAFEVDVSVPQAKDSQGRIKVVITGKGKLPPTNYGGYEDSINFYYRRTPLSSLNLPTDGTFYDGMGVPSFLAIAEQVRTLTGINCSADDFIETKFDPSDRSGYVLKSAVLSWRFEGEINIGMPMTTDLETGLKFRPDQLPMSLYDDREALSRLIPGMYSNLDLTSWPAVIAKLVKGYRIKTTDTDLIGALNGQEGRGVITFSATAVPNGQLNLYNATVVYAGARRPQDPPGYLPEQDGVIVLQPDPQFATRAIGLLYISYVRNATVKVDNNLYTAVMLNTLGTAASGIGDHAFWSQYVPGQLLSAAPDRPALTAAFLKAFGLPYEARYGNAMRVTYNGPVRDTDPLPGNNPDLNVVAIEAIPVTTSTVRGTTRVYYD